MMDNDEIIQEGNEEGHHHEDHRHDTGDHHYEDEHPEVVALVVLLGVGGDGSLGVVTRTAKVLRSLSSQG